MNRNLLVGMLLLLPGPALAEANIPTDEESKTYLLTAPGTLSGMPAQPNQSDSEPQTQQRVFPPLRFKPRNDGRVESLKFPQYGQVYGNRNNPWTEQETNRSLPPSLPPASPYYSNPWDLSGTLPGQQPASPSLPYYPVPSPYAPGAAPYPYYDQFGQGLAPGFPGGMYRDTNPAAGRNFDGWMPGMRGDDLGFPFTPFNMF